MNLQIVDLHDGTTRDPQWHQNPDDSLITNWFDNQQSVNIVHWQRFALVSDSNISSLTVSLPDNSMFFLIDTGNLPSGPDSMIDIDAQAYYDIDSLKASGNTLVVQPSLQESDYNVFTFVVCIRTEEAGTYKEELAVNDGTESLKMTIGIDSYNEDDTLTMNLSNFGVEMPSAVQKAIYDSSVHEDLNDNILLNRKWRELLMNYWNIVANKGNYKSLIDSLKWFEYGDIVRIEEYWSKKDAEGSREIFIGDDIECVLDDVIEQQLTYMKKTTYYGLYLLTNSNAEGIDSELNPNTASNETMLKWSLEDMYLKMTLLGNFYSTYFMPIHLALLHSTVERRVYAVGLKLLNAVQISRRDYFQEECPINITIENGGAGLYLEDTDAYVYMDTLFAVHDYTTDTPPEFAGVEPETRSMNYLDDDNDNDGSLSDYAEHMFSGIGKIVKFHVSIPEKWTNPDDSIWKQKITLKKDNATIIKESFVTVSPVEKTDAHSRAFYEYDFDFWLLFQDKGEYKMNFEFETLERNKYSIAKSLEIKDSGNCELEMRLVEKLSLDELQEFANSHSDNDLFNEVLSNNFSFRNTDQHGRVGNDYYAGMQYILPNGADINETVGMNHFIGVMWDVQNDLVFKNGIGEEQTIYATDSINDILNTLTQHFSHYWWDVRNPYDIENMPQPDTNYLLIRGIRKYYTLDTDDADYAVYSKKYKVHYEDEEAEFELERLIDGTANFVNAAAGDFEAEIDADNKTMHFKYNGVVFCTLKDEYDSSYNDTYFSEYGTNRYKMSITSDDEIDRLVDDDRFFPILHKCVPMDEPCHIKNYQLAAVFPTFERSFDLDESDSFNWRFENATDNAVITNRVLDSASVQPYMAQFEPTTLTNGYWNVILNISQSENQKRTIKKRSVFRMI